MGKSYTQMVMQNFTMYINWGRMERKGLPQDHRTEPDSCISLPTHIIAWKQAVKSEVQCLVPLLCRLFIHSFIGLPQIFITITEQIFSLALWCYHCPDTLNMEVIQMHTQPRSQALVHKSLGTRLMHTLSKYCQVPYNKKHYLLPCQHMSQYVRRQ